MKFLIPIILILLSGCGYESMLDNTVRVMVERDGNIYNSGSGVKTDYGVLTAAHVIQGADNIYIEHRSGEEERVELKAFRFDAKRNIVTHDIALLSLEDKSSTAKVRCGKQPIGTEVVVVGNPHTMSWALTQGHVVLTRPRSTQRPDAWLGIDATFTRGSSGGPVFNRFGQVVGIISHFDVVVFGRSGAPSGYGFAVSGKEICSLIKRPEIHATS